MYLIDWNILDTSYCMFMVPSTCNIYQPCPCLYLKLYLVNTNTQKAYEAHTVLGGLKLQVILDYYRSFKYHRKCLFSHIDTKYFLFTHVMSKD